MTRTYAILPFRVKAAVIDSIILIAAMYAVSEFFALFEEVPTYMRIMASVLIFILYDPIFTSIYGGTIGHSFAGIEVKRENDPSKNLDIFTAILRFIFKALLGWISLLTVSGNDKKRAIHDFVAKSVVMEEIKE